MKYVVLGGGVAGTTVAEHLKLFDPGGEVTLISASPTVKRVVNLEKRGEVVSSFDVKESAPQSNIYSFIQVRVTFNDINSLTSQQLYILQDTVVGCDLHSKSVDLSSSTRVVYDKLCVATGARPNIIYPNLDHVIGIRDTQSVEDLQQRLRHCRHVTVVGNGGIASEVVHVTQEAHVTWVVKDQSISSVFVDSVASKFLLDSIQSKGETTSRSDTTSVSKRHVYTVPTTGSRPGGSVQGSALGPDWYTGYTLKGANSDKALDIEYSCEVKSVKPSSKSGCNLEITLTNNKIIHSDVLVSATGVIPNSGIFKDTLYLSEDKGITVDRQMRTSMCDVYAAGDVCHIPWRESSQWKQMRLWTQALHQGFYTARSMASEVDTEPDISFEIFTHATKLFGYKVVLLGRYEEWEGCQCYFRFVLY